MAWIPPVCFRFLYGQDLDLRREVFRAYPNRLKKPFGGAQDRPFDFAGATLRANGLLG
ncbi:protein of unknown function [Methylocaldum szegediense]|uniref:Uncharacterized protein n=1 Tax=Methylocaldum szegediense TaxID=73780 RepID=A0ABM9I965_9GAMM|nr:protein of unknown function [Methylocaldum szegediense]